MARMSYLLTLPANVQIDDEIARFFRRNFFVNVMDLAAWNLGVAFVAPATILTVYASHLTDSALLVGLIPGLLEFGSFLPPVFVAPFVQRLPRKYPMVMTLGVIERIPYLLLPFAVLWFDKLPAGIGIWGLLGMVTWIALTAGLIATPWQTMIAKIIPVSHRGRLFGVGFFFGRLLGIAVAPLVALILASFAYPRNFALSFLAGLVGIWGSLFFLGLTREPARQPKLKLAATPQLYFGELRSILRGEHNFRHYLISRWLIQLARMPLGFMAIYAVQQFGFPDATAGIFTGIVFAAGMVGYAVWGMVGDRWGHKRVLVSAMGMWIVALILAPFSAWQLWQAGIYLAFAFMGFSDAGYLMASFNLPLEFGSEDESPVYIGLTRTMIGPALLIAPLLGGWLVQSLSYTVMFMAALVLSLVGGGLLAFYVAEPRYARKSKLDEGV